MRDVDLKTRTHSFALAIIKLIRSLPRDAVSVVVGRQLLRSATSVGANYRSACRARSRADFISKLTVVEEEIDESSYWLELLVESGSVSGDRAAPVIQEADELVRIVVCSVRTARRNQNREKK
jgi:four helix bundle protein